MEPATVPATPAWKDTLGNKHITVAAHGVAPYKISISEYSALHQDTLWEALPEGPGGYMIHGTE